MNRSVVDRGVLVACAPPLLAVGGLALAYPPWPERIDPEGFSRLIGVFVGACPVLIVAAPLAGLALTLGRSSYRMLWLAAVPSVLLFAALVAVVLADTDAAMVDALDFVGVAILVGPVVWIPLLVHWFGLARKRYG